MINLDRYGYTLEEIENQGHTLTRLNNQCVASDLDAVNNIIATFDPLPKAKENAIDRVNNQAQSYIEQFESKYPDYIKHRFATQRKEALAWSEDNTSPTLFIDAVAIAKQVDRVEQIQKVLEKVWESDSRAATVDGTRQRIINDIHQTTNLDDVESVNFEV